MAEQKQHKPTQKRLDNARREGNVLKSKGLTAALATFGGVFTIFSLSSFLWIKNQILLEYWLIEHPPVLPEVVQGAVKIIFLGTLLVLIPAALLGLLCEVSQVGLKFEWKLITPKMDRLNPVAGFKRLFSNCKELLLNCFKIAFLLLAIGYSTYQSVVMNVTIPDGLNAMIGTGSSLIRGALLIGVSILLAFGVLEYIANRRRFLKQLSMSDDEVRREFKEMEGDPFIRSVRRSLHQEIVLRDLESIVRNAKVVVVERN